MPPWGSPGPMDNVVDLTLDDMDVRSWEAIDLTSVDDRHPPNHASERPELNVEDESTTLVGSNTTDSGESSPNTQWTYDTAQTESNPTDPGDLSPRNPQDEDSDSPDDDLATIIARNRKRKNTAGDPPTSENKPRETQLTPSAFGSMFGSKSLKPAFGELWFNRKSGVDGMDVARPQPDRRPKAQQNKRVTIQHEGQSANDANSRILNVDLDDEFGPEEKTEKYKRKSKTQRIPPKKQSRVDEEPSIIPAPRRAVSETPETTHHQRKTGFSGDVKLSQAHDVVEIQRPHKRRKHSRQHDTINSLNSGAAALEDTGSLVAAANRLQAPRSGTYSVGKDRVTGKHSAGSMRGGSLVDQSDDAGLHRGNKTTHREKRQKLMAQVWKQAEKSQRTAARIGTQQAGLASRRPKKGRDDRRPAPDQDSSHREAHQGSNGGYSGTRAQPPFEGGVARPEAARLYEDVRGAQDIPDIRTQQSQQAHRDCDTRKSDMVYSKAGAAQPASRIEDSQQISSLDARKKDMEDAKRYFENHPSNSAPQRRVEMTNFVPPDLSKPNFAFRSRMANSSNRKRLGRKLPNAAQQAEKRDKDRQKRILTKRRQLGEEANRLFPNESEEHKEKWIEDRIAKMRQTFMKNDQKREAQKSQGFLTVDYLEDFGPAGSDGNDGPPAAAPKGKRGGIPLAEALEPGATINLYTVWLSNPVEKGKQPEEKDFKRLDDQFLPREDANKHAEAILRNEKYDDSHIVSMHFRVGPTDGLFWGIKELADGKQVTCYVQKERHMASLLDLSDTFVRKELKNTYCSRFDVWYIKIIPKVFLKEKKATTGQNMENSRAKSEANTPNADGEPYPPEKEQADDDRVSLFSATPTPEPDTIELEKDEAEEVEGGDESDAYSVVSDGTMAPSEPGGNLGSLSWNDVEYVHEHVGAFTTMELANEEAYKVARELWKPRGARYMSWHYYWDTVLPSIDGYRDKELDVQAAELVFDEVPELEGHVDNLPWPFVYSKVFVTETRLEGPRDIGNHYKRDNDEDCGEEGVGDGEEDEEDD
ncbi:hypothetical protein KVR01_008743 [Diaporthe batatas]|uniref:uncharacterized protein n=1 Tax=Diaporthe batatas TaxID=748121 RepID=UPI001D03EAFB|nr:uncharacterized protein KVR01_008743 [Diaporthe batatas]KAG8161756.1 hypothetical protein KVR01_008743 [Diaporthe batatas]